jgi:hypothetical protein
MLILDILNLVYFSLLKHCYLFLLYHYHSVLQAAYVAFAKKRDYAILHQFPIMRT